MPVQWAPTFYTPTIFSQTSEAADYPASRLVSRTRPFRAWRSTSTAAQEIKIDLGASVAVAGVCVYGCNFGTASWSYNSTSGGSYTAFSGNPYTISEDPHDRYAKQWVAQSFTDRYLKLDIPNQTPLDGASLFYAGTVFVFGTINTLPVRSGPVVPMPMTLVRPHYEAESSSRLDSMQAGPRYLLQDWTGRMTAANLPTWQALEAHDLTNPALIYFNRGNSAEVYYMGYVGQWSFEVKQVPTVVTAQFRQVT